MSNIKKQNCPLETGLIKIITISFDSNEAIVVHTNFGFAPHNTNIFYNGCVDIIEIDVTKQNKKNQQIYVNQLD